MSIRWRLTAWFAIVLSGIILVSGLTLYVLLRDYLISEVDQTLDAYSARVHGTLNPTTIGTPDFEVVHTHLPPVNDFASPGIYVQIVDRAGSVLVRSDSLAGQELPVYPPLLAKGFAGNVGVATAATGGTTVRIMASPLYYQDRTLLLEVAQSLKPVETALAKARLALLFSVVVALGLAALSGAFLVGRALSPVEKISRTARAIESGFDLTRRVGYSGPADEIGRLAGTFDKMIGRLERVFTSQRDFVADASHDLRSPLTVIKGNLDLVKRDLTPEDRRESLRAIESETARMGKIVDDLLRLAEIESGHPSRHEPVQLSGILLDGLRRAQQLDGRHRITAGKVDEVTAPGDAESLRQLLANLVDNAIRYTPEGGSITLSLVRDDGWARLEVADTGIGIAAEHLPRIFDRFYRVDKARSRASGGTGLGLAIVKGIAEQHGGKVTVTSQPGVGSTFAVWLKA